MNEFDLIYDLIAPAAGHRDDVLLGIGDDGALLRPPPGEALAVVADTLVAGRHFPLDMAAEDIGWRAAAVNLSDLAAMGATPRWATLALTFPEADEAWLRSFVRGLMTCFERAGVALVGGDTTRGPLTITAQAMGSVPLEQSLTRRGAQPGDLVFVSGTLGTLPDGKLVPGGIEAETRQVLENIKAEGAKPRGFDTYSECVDQVLDGTVDAMTTDGAILLGYAAENPDELKVVGEPFSEERYGVGYSPDHPEMCEWINEQLEEAFEDGSWEEAFEATLGVSDVETPEAPELDPCQG